ncbi:NID [Mytilus coruscus]|uniref:NID n=1 Tax=Mytilus coruscus TaxID=42192 RepID=A0A6J8CVY3_MYTCO|nr:NID [Mytilus coruscus]
MKGFVLKLYSIFILTLQTDGAIVSKKTKFDSMYRIQNACINDRFSFLFEAPKSSGLLMHLESDNSKQHQFTLTIEDGVLVFTDRVNNKNRSTIIPHNVVNKLDDIRIHQLTIERTLDRGKYLSVKVIADEQIYIIDSEMEVAGHVRRSHYINVDTTPYVKYAIYINCFCERMHFVLQTVLNEISEYCLENIRTNSATVEWTRVLGRIKCKHHTTPVLHMNASTCLEGMLTCHANAEYVYLENDVCCECLSPFYGNGIQCLKKEKRLMLRVYATLDEISRPTTSILPCQSCIHFSESRMEIRDHLVKTHKYKSLAARRTAEGMTRRNIINSKYKSPGPNIPPAREPQIHIQEEIVRLVEVVENIPRDSD